ncbi:hypothetical protein FF2_004871 [Malus domestica]
MSVSSLARMAQASDESPMDYLTRFKSARNWCRVPLPKSNSVDAAEIVIDKPYVCKALTQVDSKEVKTRSATEGTLKPSKVYTFDITKADAIFYQLLSARIIKLQPGHNIPKAEELKGKIYCKYHNSSKHTTNNYVVFRDNVQSWIDNGKLRFPEKKMSVDTDLFPTTTVNMVDACLPKDKGKGKAEAVATQRFHNQNSRPRFMVDFRSNEPPTALTGPAIVKPMMDYSTDEDSETAVLCSKCRAKVNIEPEGKSSPLIMEQPTAATQ